MLLFYAPDMLLRPELPEQESQHCVKVLRKQAGDEIDVTDGKGYFYKALIIDANPKRCQLRIEEAVAAGSSQPVRIEIAVAPTKNADRMEWLAEKATETGIDALAFLKTRYSERKELNTDRIRKILIAAMKQSEKAILPELREMIPFEQYLKQPFDGQKFIPHCRPGEKPFFSRSCRKGENARILIGPEGDFSEEEVALALSQGYQPVSLGDTRLRTETAALIVCQTVHIINQLA
ncbi:MAG: 16S rRNA (uracil(1498)-N(3))-methyltransferase [Dysgonamonadaceae bacterium]|jgi:16S rRNA (uracil1498-N3)-methyltransferase|nr:16S rRNA (uracil(1498)-N(3))-methyltransferase [Dysgonamonadaceae bacterium]